MLTMPGTGIPNRAVPCIASAPHAPPPSPTFRLNRPAPAAPLPSAHSTPPSRARQVVGLSNAYHGDTLGAMDCVPPSPFNGPAQAPWYRGRGLFFEPPYVAMERGGCCCGWGSTVGLCPWSVVMSVFIRACGAQRRPTP